jgi:cellulose biosynthesis protein BcsQ
LRHQESRVDLDPQTSATLWHSARGTNKPLVLDAIPDKLTDIVASASTLGVTLCLLDSPSKLYAMGEDARIGEAKAVMEKFKMMVCPVTIRHRQQFQAAAEKGKSVVEGGARAKKAADEIRALWTFLDGHAKRLVATAAKTKAKREAAKS